MVIYMFMILEFVVVMLVCVCIGVLYFIVFVGFFLEFLCEWILDFSCSFFIIIDVFYRGEKFVNLKELVDEVL